jgi:hypothetical protein
MKHLNRIPSQFSISIPPDETGMIGRECPEQSCESYLKIQPGTGLKGDDLPCHCLYCGHEWGQDKFFTKAQIKYAESVVLNNVTGALLKDLKSLEFNQKPRGGFGIGISMKVSETATPVRRYCEENLETEVVCDRCALRYMIYGVFGFCPDCGVHNSFQILKKNFDLIEKLLTIADTQEASIAQQLIENALEDCVSAFDGFGRETCRVFGKKAANPKSATEIRFQNVKGATEKVFEEFGVSFSDAVDPAQWIKIQHAFQKRHLLAHKMGAVDEAYQKTTGVSATSIGKRVSISREDVHELLSGLRAVGYYLYESLEAKL